MWSKSHTSSAFSISQNCLKRRSHFTCALIELIHFIPERSTSLRTGVISSNSKFSLWIHSAREAFQDSRLWSFAQAHHPQHKVLCSSLAYYWRVSNFSVCDVYQRRKLWFLMICWTPIMQQIHFYQYILQCQHQLSQSWFIYLLWNICWFQLINKLCFNIFTHFINSFTYSIVTLLALSSFSRTVLRNAVIDGLIRSPPIVLFFPHLAMSNFIASL